MGGEAFWYLSTHFTQQSEVFDRLGRGFIATPAREAESLVKTET